MNGRMTNDQWLCGSGSRLLKLAALPFVIAFCFSATAQITNNLPTLRPPYAELPPTFWEQQGSLVIGCGILVLLVVAMLLWVVLRPKPVPPVPPEVQARCALEALQGRPENGSLLSEVSQILRRYFVAAFGLPADESTTAEFGQLIGGSEAMGAELAAAVVTFLETSDVRKFAPTAPASPMNAVAQARELFERAEERRKLLSQTDVK